MGYTEGEVGGGGGGGRGGLVAIDVCVNEVSVNSLKEDQRDTQS